MVSSAEKPFDYDFQVFNLQFVFSVFIENSQLVLLNRLFQLK